jgi:hypothetical protein
MWSHEQAARWDWETKVLVDHFLELGGASVVLPTSLNMALLAALLEVQPFDRRYVGDSSGIDLGWPPDEWPCPLKGIDEWDMQQRVIPQALTEHVWTTQFEWRTGPLYLNRQTYQFLNQHAPVEDWYMLPLAPRQRQPEHKPRGLDAAATSLERGIKAPRTPRPLLERNVRLDGRRR